MQECQDRHTAYINDCLKKKEAEANGEDFYKRVERLANIDLHMAEVFIQTVGCK